MPGARELLGRLLSDEHSIDTSVLIVAAHPDDEVIGIGGQLPRLSRLNLLHVTDGAPRDGQDAARAGFARLKDYAAARRRELATALLLADIDQARTDCLGVPDQDAARDLVGITEAIAATIRAARPVVVVTHAYEGGHPDHDATAFAVHAARRKLRDAGEAAPAVVEMTGYRAGPEGIVVGDFLPADGADTVAVPLTREARALKRRMFECFSTQRETLAWFPVTGAERLRVAPRHDFTLPPHAGTLFYERHPRGMTGAQFRQLSAEALRRLSVRDAA